MDTKAQQLLDTILKDGKTFPIVNGNALVPKIKRISTEQRLITPPEANYILNNCPPDFQRHIRPSQVLHFVNLLKTGEFGNATTIVVAKTPQTPLGHFGTTIDGHHRLAAVANSGIAAWFNIDVYWCETDQMVRELYSNIDVFALARTPADRMKAMGYTDGLNLNDRQVLFLARAGRYLNNQFRIPHVSDYILREVANQVREYSDDCILYETITRVATKMTRDAMRRQGVGTVALATLHWAVDNYDPERVKDFWRGIANGSDGDMKDPVRAAGDFLLFTTSGHHTTIANRVYANTDVQARVVAECWNAYIEGKKVKYTIRDGNAFAHMESFASSGMQLLGTPFLFVQGGRIVKNTPTA